MINIDQYFIDWFKVTKKIFETLGIIIITVGCSVATINYIKNTITKSIPKKLRYTQFKFTIAKATISGLEVMIAADVISTLIEPNYYGLGLTILLVGIRTILNYSLAKDIDSVTPEDQAILEKN